MAACCVRRFRRGVAAGCGAGVGRAGGVGCCEAGRCGAGDCVGVAAGRAAGFDPAGGCGDGLGCPRSVWRIQSNRPIRITPEKETDDPHSKTDTFISPLGHDGSRRLRAGDQGRSLSQVPSGFLAEALARAWSQEPRRYLASRTTALGTYGEGIDRPRRNAAVKGLDTSRRAQGAKGLSVPSVNAPEDFCFFSLVNSTICQCTSVCRNPA